jgi:hypothetical protein
MSMPGEALVGQKKYADDEGCCRVFLRLIRYE